MPAFLFDLDGTLIDSIELILESFHHTTRSHLGRELPNDYWLKSIGRPLRDQLATVATADASLDQLLETYISFNLAEHDRLAKPYPGVVEAVRKLHRRGTPMALVTSKRRRGTGFALRLLGLENELAIRVCGDDVTHGKPHPEPVFKALEALRERPENAIFIGDSVHDVAAGHAAGTCTAAVSWGPFGRNFFVDAEPDRWFDDPAEWLAL